MTDSSERFVRVAIIDSHVRVRSGIVDSLRAAGFDIVHSGADPKELLGSGVDPHVVLLDMDLGDGAEASIEDARAMITRGWRIVIVSAMGQPEPVREFLRTDVSGFVGKWQSREELVEAISRVAAGDELASRDLAAIEADRDPRRPDLSEQERTALQLYTSGLTMDAVARKMNVSHHTAKEYVQRVRDKYTALGRPVSTKTDLYREAVRDDFIEP